MKRQVAIGFGILAGSLLLVLAVLWCLPPRTGVVSKANFDRIEKGMSIEDVGQLFGKPPDAWTGRNRAIAIWVGEDSAAAEVEFDANGVSQVVAWQDSPEDLWDRACRWLGLDSILPPMAPATAAAARGPLTEKGQWLRANPTRTVQATGAAICC